MKIDHDFIGQNRPQDVRLVIDLTLAELNLLGELLACSEESAYFGRTGLTCTIPKIIVEGENAAREQQKQGDTTP